MKAVIGIDIGGTNTEYGVVDEQGTIHSRGGILTNAEEPSEKFFGRLVPELNKIISTGGFDIFGIGIGAPNGNYFKGTIEKPANLKWEDIVPLGEIIHKATGMKVIVTNDANAAALGEMHFGVAKEFNDFIMVTLGTGLGCGIVSNRTLLYGSTGFAGELGHITIDCEGRESPFNRRGSLEAYTSVPGLKRTVAELLAHSTKPSRLRSVPFNDFSGFDIARFAEEGDPIALQAFEKTGECLGKALANAVMLLSPQAIIIAGGLAKAGELVLAPVRTNLERNIIPVFKGSVEVLLSGLSEKNAGILGAAALIFNDVN